MWSFYTKTFARNVLIHGVLAKMICDASRRSLLQHPLLLSLPGMRVMRIWSLTSPDWGHIHSPLGSLIPRGMGNKPLVGLQVCGQVSIVSYPRFTPTVSSFIRFSPLYDLLWARFTTMSTRCPLFILCTHCMSRSSFVFPLNPEVYHTLKLLHTTHQLCSKCQIDLTVKVPKPGFHYHRKRQLLSSCKTINWQDSPTY